MNDTVKERLRSLREEQNISQEKLAAELGVT
ncbi:MAG: helix-turn-helix transcriptional regulator, partial [Clostridia bacterium]|nr:helix-turn-helix transcriptional regulator [Clostridia bacterium]